MPQLPNEPSLPTMSFGDHIEELRRRLIHALLGLFAALLITLYYGRSLLAFLYAPLFEILKLAGLPQSTYTRSTVGGFSVYMKVSLIAALLLAAPWLLFQLWKFIAAGLYAAERQAALILIFLSSLMTFLGLAFFYYLLLPAALAFLIFWTTTYPIPQSANSGFIHTISTWLVAVNKATFLPGSAPANSNAPTTSPSPATQPTLLPALEADPPKPLEGQIWYNRSLHEMRLYQDGRTQVFTLNTPAAMVPLIDPAQYIDEVSLIALLISLIFQLPVIMAFLGMAGIGNPRWIAQRRKYIVFILFVVAIFFTPDQSIFSNVIVPLVAWALFELGLLLMRLFARRRKKIHPSEPIT